MNHGAVKERTILDELAERIHQERVRALAEQGHPAGWIYVTADQGEVLNAGGIYGSEAEAEQAAADENAELVERGEDPFDHHVVPLFVRQP